MKNLEWRENILDNIVKDHGFLPGYIINAIDAAYVAGLDDKEKALQERDEKWRKAVEDYVNNEDLNEIINLLK